MFRALEPLTPLPLFAGEVAVRSDAGEGRAACTPASPAVRGGAGRRCNRLRLGYRRAPSCSPTSGQAGGATLRTGAAADTVPNLGGLPAIGRGRRSDGQQESGISRAAPTGRLCSRPRYESLSSVKSGRFVCSGRDAGGRTHEIYPSPTDHRVAARTWRQIAHLLASAPTPDRMNEPAPAVITVDRTVLHRAVVPERDFRLQRRGSHCARVMGDRRGAEPLALLRCCPVGTAAGTGRKFGR
jgi:hypothetical protein